MVVCLYTLYRLIPTIIMVIPIALGAIALATPTLMNIASKVGKFYSRTGSIGTATSFGLGYGVSTNVGYNLSNSYITPSFKRHNAFTQGKQYNFRQKMPYRRYSRYSRYSRYPTRRRYSRYTSRRRYY